MFKVNEEIIKKLIYEYGKQMQTVVCMEELAELTQALSKELRGSGNKENLIEEIADVYICLKMISEMYSVKEKVIEESIEYKQMRTLKRIEGEDLMYDEDTQRWFYQNPFSQTTVCKCEDCGLYYKPILGHRCKKGVKSGGKK